jgi:SAM-dependent methyltransferase
MPTVIDEPNPALPVDPLCFSIRGWLWLDRDQPNVAAVEAWIGDTLLGETAAFYPRADVNASLGLSGGARTGFEFFAHHAAAVFGRVAEFQLRVRRRDGTRTAALARGKFECIQRDYRTHHFGVLLDQRTTAVQPRANIYSEGPSQADGNPALVALIQRHLGPPPLRLVDVGCGLGYYGRMLRAEGYDWTGAEVDAADCAELARLGLPHRRVDGRTLPFADGAFDAALCIEVLEHIPDLRSFMAEVHRVAPRKLIVSVPNCELLGYLWTHLAVPWHMLEPDHKNFFTRWSLGALLREFYGHVELQFHSVAPLRTAEGTPLHYHLFAIATAGA